MVSCRPCEQLIAVLSNAILGELPLGSSIATVLLGTGRTAVRIANHRGIATELRGIATSILK